MWMEFLAFVALGSVMGTEPLEKIKKKIEALENIWTFIGECPEWLNYHNQLDEKVQTLNGKMEVLCSREVDVNEQLVAAEFQPGKKRKREVENWLRNVQSKKHEVQRIDQEVRKMKIFLRAWLGSRVEKKIQEVEELFQQGSFSEGLLLEVPPTRGEALLTTKLVGKVTSETKLEKIWACFMNDDILRIGVWGKKGVGKTSIMLHINNRLLENPSTSDHVYWVTVSQQLSIHELQNDIAKEVGLDLSDEKEERKRAAKLYKALQRRKKCVLILDDLQKHFSPSDVGIPTLVNGCKLILTTRSAEVCRKMGCQKIIEVGPLPDEEAEKLFMENLGVNITLAPEMEENLKQIVKECDGLPLQIKNVAERLRGVDDINEWRNTLNEVRELKNWLND
uniref:Putative Disease resistance protein RPS2 n=1 Tax=Davidia involucrata TaxID=16924 RepID=A0A5B7AXA3_DAVIN